MSRSHRVFGSMLLVGVGLLVAAAPVAAASATGKSFTLTAVSRTTYSISGTVLNNATSAAVPGVSVSATGTSASGPFTSGSATTSATGQYSISHLLPGAYQLRFDPPRATNLQHGYRNSTGPTDFTISAPTTITISTLSRTGANVRLPAGFKISGKVTRSNGTTPIPNVYVEGSSLYDGTAAITDPAGNYTLEGLSPGTYTVNYSPDLTASNQTGCWYAIAASKFSASCASSTGIVVSTANVTGISPKIPNSLSLTGYVKTRAAVPVPIANAWVYAFGNSGASAVTDATGKYTITGLNPGLYNVEIFGPDGSTVPTGYYNASGPDHWVRLTANASAIGVAAAITTLSISEPPTGFFISGTIANAVGTPISNVTVQASGGVGTGLESDIASTDLSGHYSIGPIPPGASYKIAALPSLSSNPTLQQGWYLNSPPNNFTLAEASALAIVVSSNRPGINMRLPGGASISGVVTLTGGIACSKCPVYALSSTGSLIASTTATVTGAYQLLGLPAGSYKVEASENSYIIDATHVMIVTNGYYKSGAAPNFSATLAGATAIAVS